MRSKFENRTSGTTKRANERPLVCGGLHGDHVGHIWTRIDIHNNGHLRAAVAVHVRNDMGYGCPSRVQGQRISIYQWHHRIEHYYRKICLPML